MTTIVLAEDHKVVRQGIRALLSSESDLQVVGEADDGIAALDLVQRLAPDVLVVDLMLPGLGGLEVTRQVASRLPATRVVVLTMYANEAYVAEALKNGASGFVLKDADRAELITAVRLAAAGRRYLGTPFSERGLEAYEHQTATAAPDRYEKLTSREREVFQLAADGHNNPEIARRLFISPRTVEDHRASVLKKLGVKSQTDLVRYALRRGVLPLDG